LVTVKAVRNLRAALLLTLFSISCSSAFPDSGHQNTEPSRIPFTFHKNFLYSSSDDPWRLMEQIFVIEPKEEVTSARGRIIRLISFAITNTPLIIWFFTKTYPQIKECINDVNNDGLVKLYSSSVIRNFFTNVVIPGAITFAVSSCADKFIKNSRKNSKGFENFKNLITTSQNNKKIIPQEFQTIFDYFYKKYSESSSDAELTADARDILPKLRQSIYEHFSDKYQYKLIKSSIPTWAKWSLIALTLAGILKLITSTAKDGFDLAREIDALKKNTPPDSKKAELTNQNLNELKTQVATKTEINNLANVFKDFKNDLDNLKKQNKSIPNDVIIESNNLDTNELGSNTTETKQPDNLVENKKTTQKKHIHQRKNSIDTSINYLINNPDELEKIGSNLEKNRPKKKSDKK
jgi:hypothetical protein